MKTCEKLPVVNFQVVGAMGGKPTKIKLQMFLKIQIGEIKDHIPFLVIPKLRHQAIIGMDALSRWGANIDIATRFLNLHWKEKLYEIRFKGSVVKERLKISVVKQMIEVPGESRNVDIKEFELTNDEIMSKLTECHGLNSEDRAPLENLIIEYRDVFSKKTR